VDVVLPPACKYPPPSGVCPPRSDTAIVYQAGAGEANRVTIAADPDQIRISDQGAAVQPDGRCVAVGSQSVSCPLATLILVDLGDGADTFTSEHHAVIADGGAGDDALAGGTLSDDLYGGRGRDVIRGRGGHDRLYDASPREPLGSGDIALFFPLPFVESRFDPAVVPLTDPGRGEDTFDGGAGSDSVSFDGRSADLKIDLTDSGGAAGARPERDSFEDLEAAIGGAGDDRLLGDRRSNVLDGASGNDRIAGRRGEDRLLGGGGRDVLSGGPGDDSLHALPGPRRAGSERLACGAGGDRVAGVTLSYFLEDDCEVLGLEVPDGTRLFGDAWSLLPLSKGYPPSVMTTNFECPRFPLGPACRLRLDLRLHPGGTLLGSERARFSRGDKKEVSLGLSRSGMRLLRRRGSLLARVIVRENAPHKPVGYVTELHAP
jgi:Ca2+-binding RTX toxin-like protein